MKEKAVNYYKNGFSCSESVVCAAIDAGLCDKSLLAVATPFSGGMASGCLCGAIAGAQIVLGTIYGKQDLNSNDNTARIKAKEFLDAFREKRKATCCRVLSSGFEFASKERKENCTNLVAECATILEDMIGVKI